MARIDAENERREPSTGEGVLGADREAIDALLRHSFDAVALTDRESRRTVEVSDAFCSLTGYPREELIGRTSVEIGLVAEDSVRARVIEQSICPGSTVSKSSRGSARRSAPAASPS